MVFNLVYIKKVSGVRYGLNADNMTRPNPKYKG